MFVDHLIDIACVWILMCRPQCRNQPLKSPYYDPCSHADATCGLSLPVILIVQNQRAAIDFDDVLTLIDKQHFLVVSVRNLSYSSTTFFLSQ